MKDLRPLECAHAGRTLENGRASLSAVVHYATSVSFKAINQIGVGIERTAHRRSSGIVDCYAVNEPTGHRNRRVIASVPTQPQVLSRKRPQICRDSRHRTDGAVAPCAFPADRIRKATANSAIKKPRCESRIGQNNPSRAAINRGFQGARVIASRRRFKGKSVPETQSRAGNRTEAWRYQNTVRYAR